jgi:hypothetical protein
MWRGSMDGRGRLRVEAVVAATVMAFAVAWWIAANWPAALWGEDEPARAMRAYIEAAQRRDCGAVIDALSRRSRELAEARAAGRAGVGMMFCDYSPAPAKLSAFETDRIRTEDASGSTARVSATYTYERLFGFFGRGRSRHNYTMALEDGRWKIDLSEHLDSESPANRDGRAMFLVQQTWVAITNHRRSNGTLTSDPQIVRNELPGFEFPEIRQGIADASAPANTLFVATGPAAACISLRSASGTLVMVKIPQADSPGTYQYGGIPAVCDEQPLSRPYHGASSGIK